jgi:hypothetical protein
MLTYYCSTFKHQDHNEVLSILNSKLSSNQKLYGSLLTSKIRSKAIILIIMIVLSVNTYNHSTN